MAMSDFSIKRPVFAWMLMGGLILFGWISFRRMGVSQLPDVDFPVVNVQLSMEGAAPEIMETEAVDPIESTLMSVEGVRQISSASRNSSASITIEFELNKNIDVAVQEVQNKITQIRSILPDNLDPPTVLKTNPEDQPIMWLALDSQKYSRVELMRFVRDELKDKLSTVSGVGEITLSGYIEPNLRVWVSDDKLHQYSLAANDIINSIRNQHSEVPGGRIEAEQREMNVRTMGEARSPEEFSQIIINQRGNQPNYMNIKLAQVGRVEDGLADVRQISRANGQTAVGLGIRKQRGANAVDVAENVRKRLEELRPLIPEGMNVGVNFDATKFIKESIHELNSELVFAALLTAVVCWLFLGSISSTFNILLAIPTSIVGAFTALYFAGFTLNTFTLLGLTLSIGIVVDDAIMMLENIVRHREMGKSRLRAAIDGAAEISSAATITTIAIVAIFLPVVFMKGVIGKFFLQFGITMTTAVLLSLVEALTITPTRCAEFLDTSPRTSRFGRAIEAMINGVTKFYTQVLGWSLNHRWKVVIGSIGVFALSIVSVKFINKEFVPAQDQGNFLIRFQTPVGSSLQFTSDKVAEAEKIILAHPAVERIYVSIGGGGPMASEVNSAFSFLTLKDRGKRGFDAKLGREPTQGDLMNEFRAKFNSIPDLKAVIQDLSARGFSASRGFPVEFTVRGGNWDKLAEYTKTIMERMDKTGLMTDIDTDFRLGMPEVQVFPDRDRAALRGVNVLAIGDTVNALIGGVKSGRYTQNGRRYDVRVRLETKGRQRADQIRGLSVRNNYGELVPLSDITRIEERPTLQVISRIDRERAISIFANVKQGASQQAALDQVSKMTKELLGPGYRAVFTGSAQTFKESFQSLIFAMGLGIIVAYMVMASQFNSFIHPVTVLVALPFSVSGAFLALLIARQSINIYSLIGFILLMGIAKKNSILLVEFANHVRNEGIKDVREALMKACPVRLRPILMTSFATIAGAVPGALALGTGGETTRPMAVTIIGGVLFSTVLTLVVVPCVYSLFARLERPQKIEDDVPHGHAPTPA